MSHCDQSVKAGGFIFRGVAAGGQPCVSGASSVKWLNAGWQLVRLVLEHAGILEICAPRGESREDVTGKAAFVYEIK